MQRMFMMRVAMIGVVIALIVGALIVATQGTKEAPQQSHQTDSKGGHDHDGDGKSDH